MSQQQVDSRPDFTEVETVMKGGFAVTFYDIKRNVKLIKCAVNVSDAVVFSVTEDDIKRNSPAKCSHLVNAKQTLPSSPWRYCPLVSALRTANARVKGIL